MESRIDFDYFNEFVYAREKDLPVTIKKNTIQNKSQSTREHKAKFIFFNLKVELFI